MAESVARFLSMTGNDLRLGDLVGLSELSEYIGVSRRTAERWVADGTIPSFRLGGKRFIDIRELREVIEAAKRRSRRGSPFELKMDE